MLESLVLVAFRLGAIINIAVFVLLSLAIQLVLRRSAGSSFLFHF